MSLICYLWHSWKTVRDTGATTYKECLRCSARRIVQQSGGYQPIERAWLTSAPKS